MEAKQQLELTIRTATVIKSLSNLIGVENATVARLMFLETVQQFDELRRFLDSTKSK